MLTTNHVLLLLVLRGICHFAGAEIPTTRIFSVSGQGSGRCPDPVSTSGSRRDVMAVSHIDCARRCSSSSDCLHYTFRRNTGPCTLYTITPIRASSDAGCFLMLVGFLVSFRDLRFVHPAYVLIHYDADRFSSVHLRSVHQCF